MGIRCADWMRQAEADLRHARHALDAGDREWSSFAAQQAAEKALRAVFLRQGSDTWVHTLTALIGNLPGAVDQPPETLIDYAQMLDMHYILTGYPNGFASGAPTHFKTEEEARIAIRRSEANRCVLSS